MLEIRSASAAGAVAFPDWPPWTSAAPGPEGQLEPAGPKPVRQREPPGHVDHRWLGRSRSSSGSTVGHHCRVIEEPFGWMKTIGGRSATRAEIATALGSRSPPPPTTSFASRPSTHPPPN